MYWRKRTAWCLVSLFMFFVISPVNLAAANTQTAIDTIVSEIQNLYQYADTDYENFNIPAIETAQQNLASLTEDELDDIAGPLVTGQVTQKYQGTGLYSKAEWNRFVTELLALTITSDSTDLYNQIDYFRNEFAPHFRVLFGEEITMEDLARLLQDTREQIPQVINITQAGLLANADNDEMISDMVSYLYDALDAAAAMPGNEMFQNKFAELGWDKELLIGQLEVLFEKIDQDGNAMRSIALIFIRSETQPIPNSTLYIGDKPTYTVCIMGADASPYVGWHSLNNNIVRATEESSTGNFVIEAVKAGSTELLVYRDYGDADPSIDWLERFTVTVKSAPTSGGGGGGGGGGALPGFTIPVYGVTYEKYNAVFAIPEKAVPYDTRGDIERYYSSELDVSDKNLVVGNIIDFKKFTVGDFLKPIQVSLPIKKDAVDFDNYDISLFWFNDNLNKWVELDNILVDMENGMVSGETDKTGLFAVLKVKKAVPPVEPPVEPELPVLTDISEHWAKANIEYLVEKGAISGYPDNTFKPDNPITRAEFAVVLVKAFNLKAAAGEVFSDTASHWAKDYIATAAANGIVTGYSDTEFGPDDLITREQMAIMIVKAAKLSIVTGELNFNDNADISDWASSYVITAVQNQIMSGYPDNTFIPQGSATRAEAVTVICNVLK